MDPEPRKVGTARATSIATKDKGGTGRTSTAVGACGVSAWFTGGPTEVVLA
jgi:hypothetical protein